MTDMLLQQLLNCITLGSIYALIAVGFSLLFGMLNIIHFSHGDVSMLSPFLALGAVQALARRARRGRTRQASPSSSCSSLPSC